MAKTKQNSQKDLNIYFDENTMLTYKEAQWFNLLKNGMDPMKAITQIWNTEDQKEMTNIRYRLYKSEHIKRLKEEWSEDLKNVITKDYLAKEMLNIIQNTTETEKSIKIKAINDLAKLLGYFDNKVSVDMNISFGLNLDDEKDEE